MGNVDDAHLQLSALYREGKSVEKDKSRESYNYLEEAVIAGNPNARYNLGINMRGEMKHFIIAANLGHVDSIQRLKDCFEGGAVSKEEFDAVFVHTMLLLMQKSKSSSFLLRLLPCLFCVQPKVWLLLLCCICQLAAIIRGRRSNEKVGRLQKPQSRGIFLLLNKLRARLSRRRKLDELNWNT